MSLHIELAAAIDAAFHAHLQEPVRQTQDALIVHLDNGVTLTVRYAAADAYSLRWVCGDAEFGIDTAPLHRDLASFPNHLHDADGRVRPDPLTHPDHPPPDNLSRLIHALLRDPMLELHINR